MYSCAVYPRIAWIWGLTYVVDISSSAAST
jgi:hypothetical protein